MVSEVVREVWLVKTAREEAAKEHMARLYIVRLNTKRLIS